MELALFNNKLNDESNLNNIDKLTLLLLSLLEKMFNNTKKDKIINYLIDKNIIDNSFLSDKYDYVKTNLKMFIDNINGDELLIKNNVDINNDESRYEMNFNEISKIGSGGFGTVYKVFHKFERKYYAIKKIFISNELLHENYDFFKEIKLYCDLEHKNITKYYSSWIDVDYNSFISYNKYIADIPLSSICPILFIQMELCNMTLKEYLLINNVDLKNKINIFNQIVNGIEYLHNNNVVHCDIKPDNIFIVCNNDSNNNKCINNITVKIGDFGLSKKIINNNNNNNKLLKNLTRPDDSNKIDEIDEINETNEIYDMSTSVYNNIYRANEIQSHQYCTKTDIYSLGIILIELLLDYTSNYEKCKKISQIKHFLNNKNINANTDADTDTVANANMFDIPHLTTNIFNNLIIKMLNNEYSLRPNINEVKNDLLQIID